MIKEYEKVLTTNPGDAIVLNNLGVMYYLNQRVFESQSMLRKAAHLDPSSTPIRVNLAIALYKTYNPNLAIETLESVLKSEPENHRARQVLCDFYGNEKLTKEAVACYGILHSAGKLDAFTAANYSTALIDIEETDRALELLKWADAKFPDDPGVKNGLGVALYRKKKFSLAESTLRRAVELEPSASQLRFNLAMAQMAVNKRGDVLEQYKFLKTSDPELAGQLYKFIFRDKLISASPQR